MRLISVRKYLLLINQSYARGWEVAVNRYDELEKSKKPLQKPEQHTSAAEVSVIYGPL